ncbi:hypothetical protein PoMZ_04366 [Pyricularia oryzae]|uniref:Uncharacterized protein n=1 Tax=Pyricularia oryzae TaxID=318829 RepID=A0A4V1C6C5_PYROR|nr:hypothetical protein PoMZ_04366 [Pyricularia oryzae]
MHDRLNPWSREESRCSHGSLQSCSGKEFGESSRSEGSGEKGLPAWHGLASEAKENWQRPGNGMPALDPSNAGADLVGLVGAIFSFCFARTNDIASMTQPVRHKEASAGKKKEGSSMTGPRLSWFRA